MTYDEVVLYNVIKEEQHNNSTVEYQDDSSWVSPTFRFFALCSGGTLPPYMVICLIYMWSQTKDCRVCSQFLTKSEVRSSEFTK